MKIFKRLLLIISLTIISCKEKNTSHQEIYNFMQIVIKEQKLDMNHSIEITPRDRFSHSDSDSIIFNKALFEIQQKEQEKHKDKQESPLDFFSIQIHDFHPLLNFTKEDIITMKHQKKELLQFKWDNSRLGFNQSNKKNWYAFSIPLFSKDKTKAVMMIKDLCPGLCGGGKTIIFTKKDNTWSSSLRNFWLH